MARHTDQSRPSTVVFDLGGVLIDWNPRYLYRKLFDGDEAAMEQFLAEICTPAWNERQDAGRPVAEAMAELARRHPERRELIEAYYGRWTEMVRGAIDGTVAILAELKLARLDLHALSNWSAETFPAMRERFEFLAWFESILLSGEVGLIKPDPRIYRLLLERIGRQPEECLFIDDHPGNVAVAEALGFDAIRFRGPAPLRAVLTEKGLLGPGGQRA